jgi:hypothetical protein
MEEDMISTILLDRRRLVRWSTILPFVVLSAREVYAVTEKTIDRRVRSEARKYGLTFAAELPSETSGSGHAFIVWQREDDAKKMSIADAIGFYPAGEPKTVTLIFGTKGELETDIATPKDLKLTVLLNADLYQRALDQKSKWQGNGQYKALWNNCTTHVADIAHAIGLTSSNGKWETPHAYVQDLINRNN